MRARILNGCAVILLGLKVTQAQLAITETLSSASTNSGTTFVLQLADYWELTNFGTNELDLTNYRWNDNAGGLIGADPTPFTGLIIGPGESIIFYESNVTTIASAEQFRDWWGANLPANLKIIAYVGNGLSSTGDGIRLWGPNAVNDGDVIDSIDFREAVRGSSFTYNRSEIKGWQHPMTGCCHCSSKQEPRELSPMEVARLFDLLKSSSPGHTRRAFVFRHTPGWHRNARRPKANASVIISISSLH